MKTVSGCKYLLKIGLLFLGLLPLVACSSGSGSGYGSGSGGGTGGRGQWTWVSSTGNAIGVYGTQGTAAATNVPGARQSAVSWTSSNGNLLLFGGEVIVIGTGMEEMNDLWGFDTFSKEWTWMGGSNTGNAPGVYGTLGVAAATNVPGGRSSAVSWRDSSGNLWLFGGSGYDSVGKQPDPLNDLWEFSITSKEWIWVSGSNTAGATGVYGTLGVAAAGNVPGARASAVSWTDPSGNLWLFGGEGNDLWEFSTTSKEWTWVSGKQTGNAPGVYGTLGVAAPTNVPGARNSAVSWTDSSGNLWLFGGEGNASAGNFGYLNDLWELSITSKEWTWIGGSNTGNATGVYGTQGTAAATNVPGARDSAVSWTDSSGNLWLFGGIVYDSSNGILGQLNDLWEYQP